jgi:hypothetical protein
MVADDIDCWQRRHCGGRALALAIWLNGCCEASVYEPVGPVRVPERLPCCTTQEARMCADDLLKRAYPHDCHAERCAPWIRFAQTPARAARPVPRIRRKRRRSRQGA